MANCRYVLLLLLCALVSSGLCQGIAPPAWVGVYGHYTATLTGWIGAMGLDFQVMTREEFKPESLREYQLVVISRAHERYALDDKQKAALEEYVRNGGKLIVGAINFPPGGKFPSAEGTGYAEGWGSNLVLADPNCPLAKALKPDTVMRYGAWSSGYRDLSEDDVDVWVRYTEKESTRPDYELGPASREGKIAIFASDYGEGKYIWCGPHIGFSGYQPWPGIFRAMVEHLVPDGLVSPLSVAIKATVPVQQDASKLTGDVIAILDDPELPREAMPKGVTSEFVAGALEVAGRKAERLTVQQALDKGLDSQQYAALIWMPGESVPVELIKPVKAYLGAGGGLILPSGRPFAKLCYSNEGEWKPYGHEPRFLAIYQNLLPFTKCYHAVFQPECCVNLAPDLLPNLPDVWELSGGDLCLYPQIRRGFSTRTVRKLAASVSASGEVCGIPLWINDADPRFPCARVLALAFTGESHPWNPQAWGHAREAVTDFVNLVCQKRQVIIKDLWTERACYRDVEPVELHVAIVATASGPVTVQAAFAERDSGKQVHETQTVLDAKPGELAEALLTWSPESFDAWAYDVTVTARQEGAGEGRDHTLFTVWKPDALEACPDFTLRDGILYRDEKPEWLTGTNMYINDARSIVAFWGPHPLPDFWDRDFSYQDLVGANANRQHYSQGRVTIEDLRTGEFTEGLSIADSYCMVSGAHHHWTKFGVNVHRLNWNVKTSGKFPPREKWADQEFWLRTMTRRYKGAPHVHWEIINEPQEQDPSIYEWVERMKNLVVGEMGKLPSCAIGWSGFHGVWSPQAAPRGLPFHDLHWYSPDRDQRGDGLYCPFGMNLAWPAVLGEMGMPNAQTSAEAELGDWGPIYDRMLHYLIGERALGFLNFYLSNTSSTTTNEWGLLHHDLVEKESAHAFKRWLLVLRHLNKEDYLPPQSLMLYSMDEYFKEPVAMARRLRADFAKVFSAGFRPRLLDQRDLLGWKSQPRIVFVPGSSKLSDAALKKLKSFAEKGCQVVCLGEPEGELVGLERIELGDVKPQWKVEVSPELARITYVLAKKDGGQTVVLVDGTGKPGTLRFAGHELTTTAKAERSATFDFAPDGSLRVVEAWGDLTLDGEKVVTGGPDGYAIASLGVPRQRRSVGALSRARPPLFAGGAIEIDAPDQSAVRLATAPANSLATLGAVVISAPEDATYDAAVEACRAHLEGLGVKVAVKRGDLANRQRAADLVIIGSPGENPLAGEAQRECADLPVEWRGDDARPCLKFGRARTWYPWAGAIAVAENPWAQGKKLVLIEGLSQAGTQIACRKFASLTVLDSYAVGPTVRLRGDL